MFEFIEVLESICDNAFTKDEFGVKQFEGKKYLFGPGVSDHIPGQGFGQMGMGDYDKRLAAYCRTFIEEVGEDQLQEMFAFSNGINSTALCQEQCSSSASGTGAIDVEPRPRQVPPRTERRSSKAEVRPLPKTKSTALKSKQKKAASLAEEAEPLRAARASPPPESATAGLDVETVIRALSRLSTLQLRHLGKAVLDELGSRAAVDGDATERLKKTEL